MLSPLLLGSLRTGGFDHKGGKAMAGRPYTTACSPSKMILPQADSRSDVSGCRTTCVEIFGDFLSFKL